jgi:MoxR-like ATPase
MITVPVGPELINAIALACQANKPILLSGPTGVGKSECLAQAAKSSGMEFIVRDLSLMEAPDLAGLPIIKKNQMSYAAPSFLPRSGKGLMVFEELNRAPRHTRVPCLQLLTARRLNDYELPDGWRLAAAINPDEDGYNVESMDKALMARFITMHVVADKKSWLAWADRNGIHHAVRQYVRSTRKIFDSPGSNPRAWAAVSSVLSAVEASTKKFSRNTLLVNVAGLVGNELAGAFLRTYRNQTVADVPSVEQVLGSYRDVVDRIRKAAKAGNSSFLDSLCHAVLLYLQDPTNEAMARSDKNTVKNLQLLLTDLPAEFRTRLKKSHSWLATTKKKPNKRKTK